MLSLVDWIEETSWMVDLFLRILMLDFLLLSKFTFGQILIKYFDQSFLKFILIWRVTILEVLIPIILIDIDLFLFYLSLFVWAEIRVQVRWLALIFQVQPQFLFLLPLGEFLLQNLLLIILLPHLAGESWLHSMNLLSFVSSSWSVSKARKLNSLGLTVTKTWLGTLTTANGNVVVRFGWEEREVIGPLFGRCCPVKLFHFVVQTQNLLSSTRLLLQLSRYLFLFSWLYSSSPSWVELTDILFKWILGLLLRSGYQSSFWFSIGSLIYFSERLWRFGHLKVMCLDSRLLVTETRKSVLCRLPPAHFDTIVVDFRMITFDLFITLHEIENLYILKVFTNERFLNEMLW